MKSVSILGSTGSIGCNTLKVIEHLGNFRVAAIAAGRNMSLFADQVAAFRPELVSCSDELCANELLSELRVRNVAAPRIELGEQGLVAVATHGGADVVVSAAVGAVGFVPTLRAVEVGKRVALANKEALVMGGELMTRAAAASGAEILPIDSEHNAIHQCLRGESIAEVRRLILTASGGPFRTRTKQQIAASTVEEALEHPNWTMGEKITIDSATLMNKGLEVIEAKWLFGFDADQISVVVHPQSVVHSMVEMVDGSIIAQMGVTDMKHAIQYALTYPERRPNCLPPLDVAGLGSLSFEEPDLDRFPCLALAFDALRAGGTSPAVLNAANEVAVRGFLDHKIRFSDIERTVREVMAALPPSDAGDLSAVLDADRRARAAADAIIEAVTGSAVVA